jgi:cell division protein FtsX
MTMRTDELRTELQHLADEIEPFTADRTALQRRARRHRPNWTAGIAAVVVLVIAVGGALVVLHNRNDAAGGSKKVASSRLRNVDVTVSPDSSSVQRILERSLLVARYAPFRADSALGLCVREAGFAVQSATPNSDIAVELQRELGSAGHVHDVTHGNDFDVEIFMKVAATDLEVEELLAQLKLDRDLAQVTYVDHQTAYDEFKRIFADQPALIASTRPSDLPESFRIRLASVASAPTVATRYRHALGVDTVITADRGAQLFGQNAPLSATFGATRTDPEIFMKVDATDAQIAAVRQALATNPDVASFQFLDHDQAYAKFKHIYRDQPGLIAKTTPNDLPESFVVTLKDPSMGAALQAVFELLDGVDTVVLPPQSATATSCTTP